VKRLLWFRAFNRPTMEDVLGVLRDGDRPHPDPASGTRLNEENLEISPPCVYMYLGRTLEEFGKNAFTLMYDGFSGTISPFDTGGLVRKIKPLCDWCRDDRNAFLAAYSWSSDEMSELFRAFPGDDEASICRYLDGERPDGGGFYEAVPEDLPEADLWRENDSWRAWIWEGRCPSHLPIGSRLHRWTCPPEVFAEFQEVAVTRPDDLPWSVFLTERYVRGGVSHLIQSLLDEQRR
jgi:hypothetical protein